MVGVGWEIVRSVAARLGGIEPLPLHRERDKAAIEDGNVPATRIANAQLRPSKRIAK